MTEKNVLLTLRAISFLVFAGFFVFHVFSDKIKSALLLEGCYLSKGTTFHTVRRKQKAGKHNMRCSFPLFFCPRIYILYFFAFEMHTPNL